MGWHGVPLWRWTRCAHPVRRADREATSNSRKAHRRAFLQTFAVRVSLMYRRSNKDCEGAWNRLASLACVTGLACASQSRLPFVQDNPSSQSRTHPPPPPTHPIAHLNPASQLHTSHTHPFPFPLGSPPQLSLSRLSLSRLISSVHSPGSLFRIPSSASSTLVHSLGMRHWVARLGRGVEM